MFHRVPYLALGWLLCMVSGASTAVAWGPPAHAYLGRTGAASAGLDEAGQELIASGAFLADLDHTLRDAAPIGDSAAFAGALSAVGGRSDRSNLWALGWRAHVAQDRAQGRISTTDLKLYADLVLGRTVGRALGAVVFDGERIREAARASGSEPPPWNVIRRAVERLLVLGIVEEALLDAVPLELDEPTDPAALEARPQEEPGFERIERAADRAAAPLPPARELMPQELAELESRLADSVEATVQLLQAGQTAPIGAGTAAPGAGARSHPISRIPVSTARLLGLKLESTARADGLTLVTARLTGPRRFGAALQVMLLKLGRDLFPEVFGRWRSGSRAEAAATRTREHLDRSAVRLDGLFPRAVRGPERPHPVRRLPGATPAR